VTKGNGWYGFGLDVAETEKSVIALTEAAKTSPRPAELGALEISVTPPGFDVPDKAMLEAYAAGLMGHLVHGDLGPEASIGKRLVTEVEQAVFELGFDILGASRGLAEDAVPGMNADKWTRDYLYSRAASIYGGAAEIQRGIIAQRVLGLPRA